MRTMDTAQVGGYLGNDPIFQENEYGKVTYASLGINNSYKNAKGEWVESTVWVNLKFTGESAQRFSEKAKKDDKTHMEGRPTNSTRVVGDQKVTTVTIAVTHFDL